MKFLAHLSPGPTPPGFSCGERNSMSSDGVWYAHTLYPTEITRFDDPAGFRHVSDRLEPILEASPDVVLIDHPVFRQMHPRARSTPEAMAFYEQAVFQPLREALGGDALIIQYGVDGDDVESCDLSCDASQVLYDHRRIEPFRLEEEPYEAVDRFIWIPAPGAWTPRSGRWTSGWTRQAVEAILGRGCTPIIWFDPRDWSDRQYRALMAIVCYHLDWPVTPDAPPPPGPMNDLVAYLASAGGQVDMSQILERLAAWTSSPVSEPTP